MLNLGIVTAQINQQFSFSGGVGYSYLGDVLATQQEDLKLSESVTLAYLVSVSDSSWLHYSIALSYECLGRTTFVNNESDGLDEKKMIINTPYVRFKPAVGIGGRFFGVYFGPYGAYRFNTFIDRFNLERSESEIVYDRILRKVDYGAFLQLRTSIPVSKPLCITVRTEYSFGLAHMSLLRISSLPLRYKVRNMALGLELGVVYTFGKE